MSKTNVYRNGKVYVCAVQCDTCIFRPGNLMRLPRGRVRGMVKAATASGGCIPCHKTTYGQDERGEAVCRGFYEKYATPALVLATALNLVELQKV